jgi:tetratricopeptide (TPR) repeat protein
MSKLLEIFGKGIVINTVELIWHWLDQNLPQNDIAEPAKEQLTAVLDHLANHEMVQAEDKLKRYLFEAPDCCYGRMAAAAVCLRNNDPRQAMEQAQSVYFRQSSNTMALYIMGYCHERLGHVAEAVECYQDCLKFKHHLQLPRQRLAAIWLRSGRLDKTIHEYELLTSEHPDDISSLVLLGYLYSAAQDYERAIDTFNLAIISHPDNFLEVKENDEIETLLQNSMYEQALERIQWLIEQVGPMPDLIVRMADVYGRWGRDGEAIACFEHAIRIQPNSLEAMIKLGTHYLRSRRFSLAAEQFNQAAEINDEIVDAYIGLATAYKCSGDLNEAGRTLSLSSSIQQNSTLLFSEAATLHFQAIVDDGRLDDVSDNKVVVLINDVIRAHKDQVRHFESRADVHYKYGILMMVENNYPEAIGAFEKTIHLNPIHYRARNKLCLCLHDNSRVDDAMNIITHSQLLSSAVLESYYRTAILYCDKAAFAKAVQKIQTRMGESIQNTEVHTNLEIILENLGMVDRAFTNWHRMIETAGNLTSVNPD